MTTQLFGLLCIGAVGIFAGGLALGFWLGGIHRENTELDSELKLFGAYKGRCCGRHLTKDKSGAPPGMCLNCPHRNPDVIDKRLEPYGHNIGFYSPHRNPAPRSLCREDIATTDGNNFWWLWPFVLILLSIIIVGVQQW